MNQEKAPGFGMSPVLPADGGSDSREPQTPQARLVQLADQMLIFRPVSGVASAYLHLANVDPLEVMKRVVGNGEASFSRLLIPDGEQMPSVPLDDRVILADSTRLTRVRIEAHRTKEKGQPKRRKVEIVFSYRYPGRRYGTVAMQRLSLEHLPDDKESLAFDRVAKVNPDDDMLGYHRNGKVPATNGDAAAFLGIVEGLFEAWKLENKTRVENVTDIVPQDPSSTTS